MTAQRGAATVPDALGDILEVASPPVSTEDIESLARAAFGIHADASALGGERDRNFHLKADDGRAFVLKVIHPSEPPDVSDLQSRLLLHIEQADESLPVPRLIRPRQSSDLEYLWLVDGQPARRVRCLTYLEGRPLHLTTRDTFQRRAVGAFLGRLDRAMRAFSHPADDYDLLWDMKAASRVRPFLDHLSDHDKRSVSQAMLDRFARHTLPTLPHLRHQIIHNDFNPHNVLVDEHRDDRIAGVIDFGDLVRSPLVQDLAVASAYQLGTDGHPLQGAADVATGFHAVNPLQDDEIEALPDLIGTRLAMTMAISSLRAQRHPDNAAYILRNQAPAWAALQRLHAVPREDAVQWFRAAVAEG
jgi:Ser/Thr protein kinase RdoA (MazF antagonist)